MGGHKNEPVRKDLHTELMKPGGIIDLIEQQVDGSGLIDVSMLEQVTVIPIGSRDVVTNAYQCTDEQFISFFLEQLGYEGDEPKTLRCNNRLKVRMLMLACLRYAKELQDSHWRHPRPTIGEVLDLDKLKSLDISKLDSVDDENLDSWGDVPYVEMM